MDPHKIPIAASLAYAARSAYFSTKAVSVDVIKFGPPFGRVLSELEASQWYTKEQFEEMQVVRLRALVRHAYDNVPYYRKTFNALGLTPEDIKTASDIRKLPLLDKSTLRNNASELVSKNWSRVTMFPGWTTGTTGTPLNALRSRHAIVSENAMIWRQRRLAGLSYRCRKVAVWGSIWDNVIVPASQTNPPFWRFNVTDNQLLLSYYHMSDETLPLYVRRLEAFAPELIEGFPSTLLVLARYLKKIGKVIPVKGVFTSSESLYKVHRLELEESFGAKVFDLYGQAERVVAATECEHHTGLHVNPEYGIFEILHDGSDITPGQTGEVVGTGLNNFLMPLIRYRTGDLATMAKAPCTCGRQMPLLQGIEGRKGDAIRTRDGRTVPGNGLMGALHGIANINRSQIIQEQIDQIIVKIQRENHTLPVDADCLRANLAHCLGKDVRIDVQLVDDIDRGGRTKFRWVISHLS